MIGPVRVSEDPGYKIPSSGPRRFLGQTETILPFLRKASNTRPRWAAPLRTLAAKSPSLVHPTPLGSENAFRLAPASGRALEPLSRRVTRPTAAVAQLEVTLPSDMWISQFTARHPDVRLLIFNQLLLSRYRCLVGIELCGDEEIDHAAEIRSLPRVTRVERLTVFGRPTRYLVEVVGSPFLRLLGQLNLLFTYPVTCQQGVCRVHLMDRVSKLRALEDAVRQLGGEVRITRARRGQVRSSSAYLTAAQARLFHKAVAVGYFDVPRRVTLEKFAHQVGLSMSWVSTALASVEKKLAEAAIADVPFPTVRTPSSTKGF